MNTPHAAMAEVDVSDRLDPMTGRLLVEGDPLRSGDLLVRASRLKTSATADLWTVLEVKNGSLKKGECESFVLVQTVPGGTLWRRFKEWLLGPTERPLPDEGDRLVVLANARHEHRGTASPEVVGP